MVAYFSKLWEPIPRDELAVLYAEKLRLYRRFTVLVMSLAALLSIALWSWDFAVDPIGARHTLAYRLVMSFALALFAFYLHLGIFPRLRTVGFVASMIASQAFFFPILAQLEGGSFIGAGAPLFWLIFLPLAVVGLTLKDGLWGLLGISVAPLIWQWLNLINVLLIDVFILYIWPASLVVAVILFANNQFMLQMLRKQKHLVAARDEAEQMARVDVLTGLYNRRAFIELGDAAFVNAKRYKHPLSVLVLDLDFFKRINDTYGHGVGDSVIQKMAELIGLGVRESDISARIGGEEFAVVLIETDLSRGIDLAERLRKAVSTTIMDMGTGFSASFGVAQMTPENKSLNALIVQADKALYEAKEGGRDRVVAYRE